MIEGPKHGRLHATRTKGHNSLRGSYVLLIFISLRSLAKPNETKVGAGAGERAFFASKLKCWAKGIFEIHEANFRPTRRMEAEKACIMQIDASTYCKCSVEERRRAVGLTIFLPKDHRMERRAYVRR